MKKLGRIYWSVCGVLFIAFLWVIIQTFKPINNVAPDDVMTISGKVVDIFEGGGYDIHFTLENDTHYYYINRGLTHQLTIDALKKEILNKNVTLYVIDRWTLFTRDGNMGHISKLIVNDHVIFNEIHNDIHEKTTR